MVGRDKEGLWADSGLIDRVESCLKTLKLDQNEDYFQWVFQSPGPVGVELHKDVAVEINWLSVAGRGQSTPPRRHPAGTVLLFRRLYGDLVLKSVILTGQQRQTREVSRETLQDDGDGNARVLRRLGGLSWILQSTSQKPSAVLEVALYPPTRRDEGLADVNSWEEGPMVHLLKAPADRLDRLFEQRTPLGGDPSSASASGSESESNQRALVAAAMTSRVGGLSLEINKIARRILASRALSPDTLSALGIQHVRGLLLHGPPGTGKTLVARELARQLNATDTTVVVNGPEVFDKYVGVAEARVRGLFEAAEDEWKLAGPQSRLHVIILDELDAVARTRSGGSGDGSSTRDSVVNQLLSKIDGVAERGNVLVVGLTNRIELVDPALLRPGRLEVQLHLGLPDLLGRQEILQIALRNMTAAGLLHVECGTLVPWLSKRTEGYSGADLVGLVRAAASFSIDRALGDGSGVQTGSATVVVRWTDFEAALEEEAVRPMATTRGLFTPWRSRLKKAAKMSWRMIRIADRIRKWTKVPA